MRKYSIKLLFLQQKIPSERCVDVKLPLPSYTLNKIRRFLGKAGGDLPPAPNALLAVGASAVDKDALGGDVA